MQPAITIRAELEQYLKNNDLTVSQFSKMSGIHSGTLSRIVNGSRPIAMQQLERITSGMGLDEGAFYDLYVDECFVYSTPNWRRLRPFLHRCADLNKLECISKVAVNLMDNLLYARSLFETAEEFFNQGRNEAAALLYKSVAESERYQHSERLALCQYRLFKIALSDDQDDNLRAAVYFEYFVERLDVSDQLDALRDLANIYASLHRWSEVDKIAEEMGRKASIQYNIKRTNTRNRDCSKEPARPVCYYVLYSYLLKAAVCDEFGDYKQALYYVSRYSDITWIQEDTWEVQQIKDQFTEWAVVNTYLYQLMDGQTEVLPDYLKSIELRENEIFPALLKIVQAANVFHINVDEIIERYSGHIANKEQQSRMGPFNIQIIVDRYTNLLCELAVYYLNTQRYETGISYILKSLQSSVKINSDSSIVRCMGLFEQYRHLTTIEDHSKYKILISEVLKRSEKKNADFVVACL